MGRQGVSAGQRGAELSVDTVFLGIDHELAGGSSIAIPDDREA